MNGQLHASTALPRKNKRHWSAYSDEEKYELSAEKRSPVEEPISSPFTDRAAQSVLQYVFFPLN